MPRAAREIRYVLWLFSLSTETFEKAANGDVSQLEADLERDFYRRSWGSDLVSELPSTPRPKPVGRAQQWFAEDEDDTSFPKTLVSEISPCAAQLGISMLSVREVRSAAGQERWWRRADLLHTEALLTRTSSAMRAASWRRASAYPAYDAYARILTDAQSWETPVVPQRFGQSAPTTVPCAENAPLCETILPVRVYAHGLHAPTGFKIVVGFTEYEPEELARASDRFDRLTQLLSDLFSKLYTALGDTDEVVRSFGDDVARTFFSILLSPVGNGLRATNVALTWLHSACEANGCRFGETVETTNLKAILSEARNALRQFRPAYVSVWRIGSEVSLSASAIDVSTAGVADDLRRKLEDTFRWGRVIWRFRELLRNLDFDGIGMETFVWNPKTRTVRSCRSGEELPFLLQLPRVISAPMVIQVEYDALNLRVSVYSSSPLGKMQHKQIGPHTARALDGYLSEESPREDIQTKAWRVRLTFQRSGCGARPLDVIPWDLDALGHLLRGVSSGKDSACAMELYDRRVGESLEASPEFRNFAINLSAVVYNGGAYSREYCQRWTESPLNLLAEGGNRSSYDWFVESVIPCLKSHEPESVAEVLEAASAMLRPEGFEERNLDPVILRAGTICLGGLRRYIPSV